MANRRGPRKLVHGAPLRDQRRLLRRQVGGRHLGPAPHPRRHCQVQAALRTQNAQIGTTGERSDSAMNAIPDKFAQWDAAYVLGALSPAERREFEEHLASCPSCKAEVSELAAIPGLLAQLSPDDAAMLSMADETLVESAETPALGAAQSDVVEQGPPPSLLPKMIKKVRTRRRRIVAAIA